MRKLWRALPVVALLAGLGGCGSEPLEGPPPEPSAAGDPQVPAPADPGGGGHPVVPARGLEQVPPGDGVVPGAGPHGAPTCDGERCAAADPPTVRVGADDPTGPLAVARTGKRTRGANTQLTIPQNLVLADIDADGSSDFLQFSGTRVLVSKTDFNKTGVLHLYADRPIKRVLTGDFHGDGYDQTCLVLDTNALVCYGISTDRKELWWWFTQGSIFGDGEDGIVGDFDGDGRDDVLVYPRAGGPFRMYSMKGNYFLDPTPAFNQGNLAGAAASGMQLRAGDFNGDGRDDIMVINPSRQILYYAAVNDGTYNTFWWAFTTYGGFVGADEQVTVARVDDNAADDVVLHSQVSGATRFFRMQYASGGLTALPVTTGQIHSGGNSLLFWGFMHGALAEPGAYYRDDAMAYDLSRNLFVRSDARWDGTQLTYWWAYTQLAPNNHAGWAPFTAQPWLLLKCKFSDINTEPQPSAFYRSLMFDNGGLFHYWRDISYGSWDLRNSRVIDTWYRMSITNAAWSQPTVSRYDRVGYCINAYGGSTAGYVNVIGLVNGEGDAGNGGGRVLMTPNISNVTFLAHETGHTFGWGHSFDDTTRKAADWSAPGEYFDYWDIMSAMNVYSFANPLGVSTGPEMNAPFKARASFIPAHRTQRLVPGATPQSARLNIAAIHRPEANGALLLRVGDDDSDYYTMEYRMRYAFDQGIPRDAVLVHRVRGGVPYLITAGGTERLVGSTSSFTLNTGRTFTVVVNGFAAAGYTADVTVSY